MDQGYLPQLLKDLCAEIGAELALEPTFRRAGVISFAKGGRRFFKSTCFDLNSSAAAQVAADKFFCAQFLAMAGLPTPEGTVAFAPKCIAKWKAKNPALAATLDPFAGAKKAAQDWGFPLYVKPNEGAEGEGVRQVRDEDQLMEHLSVLYQEYDRVLIQRPAQGDDTRIVVLEGEVAAAYQRLPLAVTGSGRKTIAELLAEKAVALAEVGRRAVPLEDDPRIVAHLAGQGLSLGHCLAPGITVPLLANANLSTGGEVHDVSDRLHGQYRQMAKDAVRAVGLRFAGVDILCAAPDAPDPEATVLEVNGAPGLNNFAATSAEAYRRVEALYRALIKILEREAGASGRA